MNKTTYVYILTDPFRLPHDFYKVGYHGGDYDGLIDRYRTELAHIIILGLYSGSENECKEAEKMVKNLLKDYSIPLSSGNCSEWYFSPIGTLKKIVKNAMNGIETTVPNSQITNLGRSLIEATYTVPKSHNKYVITKEHFDDVQAKKNPKSTQDSENYKNIKLAIKNGDLPRVKKILPKITSRYMNYLLGEVFKLGNFKVINLVLPYAQPTKIRKALNNPKLADQVDDRVINYVKNYLASNRTKN